MLSWDVEEYKLQSVTISLLMSSSGSCIWLFFYLDIMASVWQNNRPMEFVVGHESSVHFLMSIVKWQIELASGREKKRRMSPVEPLTEFILSHTVLTRVLVLVLVLSFILNIRIEHLKNLADLNFLKEYLFLFHLPFFYSFYLPKWNFLLYSLFLFNWLKQLWVASDSWKLNCNSHVKCDLDTFQSFFFFFPLYKPFLFKCIISL